VNKYVLFMTMVFSLVLITLLVQFIDGTITNSIIIDKIPSEESFDIWDSLFGFVSIFYRMLTFQVTSIPSIFNLLIFYPLTAGVLFMIIDIIRGNR
jgi:hypothetical protein